MPVITLRPDERQPNTWWLVLNRPQQLNALSTQLLQELQAALVQVAGDRRVRALILAASGRVFCAGADLKTLRALAGDVGQIDQYMDHFNTVVDTLAGLPIPTVAAIQGGCYGGGVSLTLACDFRIATEECTFALPSARLGVLYTKHDIARLMRAVGHGWACRMLLAAESCDAQAAQANGLVHWLCSDSRLEAVSREKGSYLAQLSLASIGHSKYWLNRLSGVEGVSEQLDWGSSTDVTTGLQSQAKEGHPSFAWHPETDA
ncbi:MAG: enoyl-CoA hydratase/isomerase family protein [Gammaproteobacteria bacterium]